VLDARRLKRLGRLAFVNRAGEMFGECARIFREVLQRLLVDGDFRQIVVQRVPTPPR
jgi:hypothetical protein